MVFSEMNYYAAKYISSANLQYYLKNNIFELKGSVPKDSHFDALFSEIQIGDVLILWNNVQVTNETIVKGYAYIKAIYPVERVLRVQEWTQFPNAGLNINSIKWSRDRQLQKIGEIDLDTLSANSSEFHLVMTMPPDDYFS